MGDEAERRIDALTTPPPAAFRRGSATSERKKDQMSGQPGPWFIAGYDGECDRGDHEIDEGDEIRADGEGGWECRLCIENDLDDKEFGPVAKSPNDLLFGF